MFKLQTQVSAARGERHCPEHEEIHLLYVSEQYIIINTVFQFLLTFDMLRYSL